MTMWPLRSLLKGCAHTCFVPSGVSSFCCLESSSDTPCLNKGLCRLGIKSEVTFLISCWPGEGRLNEETGGGQLKPCLNRAEFCPRDLTGVPGVVTVLWSYSSSGKTMCFA